MVNVICIIQARLTSSRLPNKVLMELGNSGKTIIEHIIDRLSTVKTICKRVVAIPDTSENDLLADFLEQHQIEYYRGDENDVLKRYCDGIRKYNAEFVVRATSDNPLVDVENLDSMIATSIQEDADYTYYKNCPLGLGVEICKASSLLHAEKNAIRAEEREHVCPHLYLNKDKYKCLYINYPFDFGYTIRFTVDTPEDLHFMNSVYSDLFKNEVIKNEDLKFLIDNNPQLLKINSSVHQKNLGE